MLKPLLKSPLLAVILFFTTNAFAQNKGVLSGNFQSNFSVFVRDSAIGAYEPPQYNSDISSAEAWLFLNYQIGDFNIAARYDLFNNSNLLNPTGSFSGHGLGFWQVKKKIDKLTLTVGSFYDQFGSGLIFRSYENRLIGIDYAVEGVHARYDISPSFYVKAFTGNQKGSQSNRFGTSEDIIKGINSEKIFYLKEGKGQFTLGASAFNRTLSKNSMNEIATEINSYDLGDRFDPKYNVYAYSGYVTATFGDFTGNFEYNGKSKEAQRDEQQKLVLKPGNILLGTLSYSKNKLGKEKHGGIGINLQYRRIDHYQLKINPNVQLLNGLLTYQPSMSRQATYRLLARYTAAAQDYGEEAYQANVIWTIGKGKTLNLNYSHITGLTGKKLYHEYFMMYEHKFGWKFKTKVGLQSIFYNQQVYQAKDTSYHNVKTVTPFCEFTYKVTRRNSLRFECQYLMTKQDLGSFVNAILELNMSPHYSFALSDMVNVDPVRHSEGAIIGNNIIHYWTVFSKFNINTTSFTLAYVKQVEGVNCTGGICRLEPAFSGVKFTLTTNF
ncbi:MAG: hypothetical protein GC181_00930 [Bacteroidetes bacterium]|nr:hypothetical protein [Bacteroidota bacterium]